MEFEEMIGLSFQLVSNEIGSFKIENNDFELELQEGIEERFFVKASDNSFEMILDKDQKIKTIFLYPTNDHSFPIEGYTINMGRNEIRNKLGNPDKHGEPLEIPILGTTGGYDRYNKKVVLHFEYEDKEQKRLKKITLMTPEVAP